ncbi:MAG: DUF4293 domain-containing protein [Bacteroidia bacterium]|nr:DUF4293 domain-containing protein [Bacteroidia bacterium]
MIQRPQTLFYLAMLAISVMLIFSDTVFYTASDGNTSSVSVEYDETELIASDGSSKEQNTLLVGFLGAIGILALIAMVMFKNRKLQTLLSGFNYLFILGMIVVMYLNSLNIKFFENGESSFTFYALLPLSYIFFNFLAMKGVRKDEKLIRSMDRLR